MGLGLGLNLGLGAGGGVRAALQYLFNGFPAPDTYTSGALYVEDYLGNLVTAGVDKLAIPGMRLATTVAEGAQLGMEEALSTFGTNASNSVTLVGERTYRIQGDGTVFFGVQVDTSVVGKTYLHTPEVIAYGSGAIKCSANGVDSQIFAAFTATPTPKTNLITTTNNPQYGRGTPSQAIDITIKFSVREVIPTWYTTDTEGAPLFGSASRRTKSQGGVTQYTTGWKGMLVMPARTNLFLNSAAPVTQNVTTTAQAYTISVIGTGDITVSGTATGTATEASPLTVTATAGTLTCTVNGTLTHGQVEAGSFKTPKIVTAGATVTRAATVPSFTSANRIRTNDMGGRVHVIPSAAGQTGWLFNSYTGAAAEFGLLANPTTLVLRNRNASVDTDLTLSYTHVADRDFEVDWLKLATGMHIRVREKIAGTWQAWSDWEDLISAGAQADATIAATYQYARNGANQFAARRPNFYTMFNATKAKLGAL